MLLCVCLGIGTLSTAFAAGRTVAINGSSFFYTNGGADVGTYDYNGATYRTFVFSDDDDNVVYRYNLAYQWYTAGEKTVGESTVADYANPVKGWFNLQVGFPEAKFERFTIKFQSQQYAKTKEGVTNNYITFVKQENGFYVIITDDEEVTKTPVAELTDATKVLPTADVQKVTIAFTAYDKGAYAVSVSAGASTVTGELVNIGNTFAKRVNSTTKGVMPLSFQATYAEGATAESTQMVLYSMNGQGFSLENDRVRDETPPVLCIDGDPAYVKYGTTPSISYTTIDVLASSPKTTVKFYTLSGELFNEGADYDYEDVTNEELFNKNSTDYDIIVESSSHFLTDEIRAQNASADATYQVGCLVKVYYEITDVTSTQGNNSTDKVFLDWYLGDNTVTVNGHKFVKAVTDTQGVTYGDVTDAGAIAHAQDYQEKVDELSKDENGADKLLAGSSSNFYLPAYTGFLTDNLDDYENLTYSIYYTVNGTQKSNTGLKYNNLSIPLSEQGQYKFTIYATDLANNDMYYVDGSGNVQTFNADKIYEDDIKERLFWFEFGVTYNGASVEDPGEQSTAYVGTTYSNIKFDINGISTEYTTKYRLFLFDREAYIKEMESKGVTTPITYKDFVEDAGDIFNDTSINGRKFFTEIKPSGELIEGDKNYDLQAKHKWNDSSLSFVPQDASGYYMVQLTVTDKIPVNNVTKSYLAIHVSEKAIELEGESDWWASSTNVASVVLFSVAGVCLIALAVMFIIKPKEKTDLDERMDTNAAKGKNKKSK